MNKILLRFFVFSTLIALLGGIQIQAADIVKSQYKINKIPMKAPVMTASMKPGVNEYNKGNYVGAVQIFKKVVKEEPKNSYAKYYLALAYTKLGYKSEATAMFQEVTSANDNYALSYYSQKAMMCVDNQLNPDCMNNQQAAIADLIKQSETEYAKQVAASKQRRQEQIARYNEELKQYKERKAKELEEQARMQPEASDIEKFIESKQKIHPSAMDRITRQKMELKVEQAQRKALENSTQGN